MSGIVNIQIEPNFKRLGIKKRQLHVYLSDGDIASSALRVSNMDGILSTSVHIGNSDVVGEFVYEDNEKLVDTISNMEHMDGVPKVLWSEEVNSLPVNAENILGSYKKLLGNGNNRHNRYTDN
jgi:hypothetical protein